MLSIIHISLLHEKGSNNPLGIANVSDFVPFVPYYGVKDLLSLNIIIIIFVGIIALEPDILCHSDNFILANPLMTPTHIVPE